MFGIWSDTAIQLHWLVNSSCSRWRSGESTRLPPMCPGFKSRRRHQSYVDWVCCWFSPLLRGVFLLVLLFSLHLKNQHFQISIQPGIRKTKNHLMNVLLLNLYLFIYFDSPPNAWFLCLFYKWCNFEDYSGTALLRRGLEWAGLCFPEAD